MRGDEGGVDGVKTAKVEVEEVRVDEARRGGERG